MTIILKNLNYEIPAEDSPWQVRIDRGFSILANPYKMKTKSETERQLVVARYRRWFQQNCARKDKFLEEVYRLYEIHKKYGKLELFCWCTPKRCHGDVIKNYIETALRENCYDNR